MKKEDGPGMNVHEAETRQFLALIRAGCPTRAVILAAIRSKTMTYFAGAVALFALANVGVPHEIVSAVVARLF